MTQIHYDENGYIMLGGIELPLLPESVTADGCTLVKKNEFHITLVGAKALTYLPEDIDRVQVMKDAVNEFAKTHRLDDFTIQNAFRLVRRQNRVTVVAMVDVPSIHQLYAFLNAKFAIALPTQPTHVTLYSLDPNVGISINSQEELAETEVIALSDVRI